METFDHILNWKLKAGSHKFPGPDGGTCINEAALVAAGFEYQPIQSADQMPPCFSRPICRFAMMLNDSVGDNERQLLLPFVTRLACADTPEIERKRAAYIEAHIPKMYVRARMTTGITVTRGIEVLEGALAIGRQAEPLTPDIAQARMEAVKDRANTAAEETVTIPTKVAKVPLFTKVKSWLAKTMEPAT